MKRRRQSCGESGQAFSEMMICLIPFLFLFFGICIVGLLGLTGVQNTVRARFTADCSAASGSLYDPSSGSETSYSAVPDKGYIYNWKQGKIPGPDDKPSGSSGSLSQDYTLSNSFNTRYNTVSGSGEDSLEILDMTAESLASGDLADGNRFGLRDGSYNSSIGSIFLSSADLFGVRATTTRAISRFGLRNAGSIFRSFLDRDPAVAADAYMPRRTVSDNSYYTTTPP